MGILGRSDLGLADIDTDRDAGPATSSMESLEAGGHCVASLIVESEAVDQRLLLGIAEESGFRVAGLGKGRDRPDFGESKPECLPGW